MEGVDPGPSAHSLLPGRRQRLSLPLTLRAGHQHGCVLPLHSEPWPAVSVDSYAIRMCVAERLYDSSDDCNPVSNLEINLRSDCMKATGESLIESYLCSHLPMMTRCKQHLRHSHCQRQVPSAVCASSHPSCSPATCVPSLVPALRHQSCLE